MPVDPGIIVEGIARVFDSPSIGPQLSRDPGASSRTAILKPALSRLGPADDARASSSPTSSLSQFVPVRSALARSSVSGCESAGARPPMRKEPPPSPPPSIVTATAAVALCESERASERASERTNELTNELTSERAKERKNENFKVMKMLNAGRGSVRFLSLNSAAPLRTKKGRIMDSIIRVDHAGEFGADRIYAGQMAILRNSPSGPMIEHMWKQEQVHRQKFEELIRKYGVRPTALLPVWNVAGFLLGASTALLGEKAAMACTVAVEDVIVEHYNDQLRTLMEIGNEDDKEILDTIKKFRDDELDHYDTGLKHGAKQAPFYEALTNVIKLSCKTAITISKVI